MSKITISSCRRREAGGTWLQGESDEHTFEALVFPSAAADYVAALGETRRVAKLWVQRHTGREVNGSRGATVANYDRGWDVRPVDAQAASLVETLIAALPGLAYPFAWPEGGAP